MKRLRRRVVRSLGAAVLVLGLAMAVSSIGATAYVYWAGADVPWSVRTLATVPTGLGLFVIGLGLLIRKAGASA